MKFMLIHPSFSTDALYAQAPLGALYVAAMTERDGHQVKVMDGTATRYSIEENLAEVDSFMPDVVGISGHINTILLANELGRAIKKKHPQIKIVMGGPHITALPLETMENESVDYVVVGEAEYSFVDLLRYIESGKGNIEDISGLYYRQDGEVKFTKPPVRITDLDSLPFPARHLIPMENYIHRGYYVSFGFEGKHLNLIASRGCPNNCFFCCKAMFGRKVTYRSVNNIVDEIEQETKKYDIPNFELSDYDFTIQPKMTYEFCNELKRRTLDLKWYCKMRVNNVTEDLLRTCRDAGMRRVSFGIESADENVLELMRKNIDLNKVEQVFKWTKKLGVISIAFFMVGNPGDTEETVEKSLRFSDRLECDLPNFTIATPIPGTELYDWADKHGWIGSFNYNRYVAGNKDRPVMRNEALDYDALQRLFKKCTDHVYPRIQAAFQKYHGHNPSYIKRL